MSQDLDILKKNEELKKFIEKNNINDEVLETNYLVLSRFIEQLVYCYEKAPLSECKQLIQGLQPKLSYENKQIYISTTYCSHWQYENENYKLKENIVFADYDIYKNTQKISQFLKENINTLNPSIKYFLEKAKEILLNKNPQKGVYLCGSPGIGKTYLMKILANSFAFLDKKVILVTVNKLIKTVKETFNSSNSNDYNKFLELCTRVDVLILDDIGAELVSNWSKDDLLFGILNTRLENNKLTFFTSNFTLNQLEKLYLKNIPLNNDMIDIERIRTTRIIERIKGLAEQLSIKGENKRY
ncbi:ATP-binding protein [Spiroplasma tabanidicola]|uniref:Primosomal protein DnaI n=1 Tax=Spiroplasma tabanidicola TaxID=324079 RepID=A0A6I6CE50_9MOLU|nr:ATP-binding protein [Spiroplasma tabanidicola]QGS52254.1 primosomal protein DnaI [Spiroplasma tabanidicola]